MIENNNNNISTRKQDRHELEFERYCNNNSATGINYEAAYDQLLQHHSDRDIARTEDEEEDEDGDENDPDGLNYRKVPIKDLINSFENQSRPVMRYKLADEQIIRKVYNKGEVVVGVTNATQDTTVVEEQSEKQAGYDTRVEPEAQLPDNNNYRNCGGVGGVETTDEDQQQETQQQQTVNYDSDACQGIRPEE